MTPAFLKKLRRAKQLGGVLALLLPIAAVLAFRGGLGEPLHQRLERNSTPVFVALMLALFSPFVFMLLELMLGGAMNIRTLRRGIPARATVVKVRDGGMTVNEDPVIVLDLLVTPDVGAPFPAEARQVVCRLRVSDYAPGTIVEVKYQPDNGNVALVGLA